MRLTPFISPDSSLSAPSFEITLCFSVWPLTRPDFEVCWKELFLFGANINSPSCSVTLSSSPGLLAGPLGYAWGGRGSPSPHHTRPAALPASLGTQPRSCEAALSPQAPPGFWLTPLHPPSTYPPALAFPRHPQVLSELFRNTFPSAGPAGPLPGLAVASPGPTQGCPRPCCDHVAPGSPHQGP